MYVVVLKALTSTDAGRADNLGIPERSFHRIVLHLLHFLPHHRARSAAGATPAEAQGLIHDGLKRVAE